jgi:hypothetical protein
MRHASFTTTDLERGDREDSFPLLAAAMREGRITGRGLPAPGTRKLRSEPDIRELLARDWGLDSGSGGDGGLHDR